MTGSFASPCATRSRRRATTSPRAPTALPRWGSWSARPSTSCSPTSGCPGVDGLSLFRRARQAHPEVGVVLMTAYADADDAVAVMREGARDYLQKPFEMEELLLRVGRVRDELAFRRQMRPASRRPAPGRPSSARRATMVRLRDRVEAAAASDVPVLISGETGTGKDLGARAIHERSRRAAAPFVVVNCAAIPETLFESELFGHEKGAFTGADRRRTGRFEAADGGTLFLDEVGELTLGSQAKLLRAIETSTFEPVGSTPHDAGRRPRHRRDQPGPGRGHGQRGLPPGPLLPAQRHRRRHPAAARTARRHAPAGGGVPRPDRRAPGRARGGARARAVAALATHDYPGNVRELLHALERGVALARGGPIRLEHLPPDMASAPPPSRRAGGRRPDSSRSAGRSSSSSSSTSGERSSRPEATAAGPPRCWASRARACGSGFATREREPDDRPAEPISRGGPEPEGGDRAARPGNSKVELPAVGVDDGAGDREPQARALALRLGGEERVEDPVAELGRNAGAVVLHRDADQPARWRSRTRISPPSPVT